MSAELAQYRRVSDVLSIIPQNEENLATLIEEKIAPYIKNPADIPVALRKTGFSLGEQTVYVDKFNRVHTTNVLDSSLFNVVVSENGTIHGYFHQFTSYESDGFGILHPNSVPHKKLINENGRRYEDHTPRNLALSGKNEAQRILIVTYDTNTGGVGKQYVEGRNMRFGLMDKRRLEERYEVEQKLANHSNITVLNGNTDIHMIPLLEGEVSIVAD